MKGRVLWFCVVCFVVGGCATTPSSNTVKQSLSEEESTRIHNYKNLPGKLHIDPLQPPETSGPFHNLSNECKAYEGVALLRLLGLRNLLDEELSLQFIQGMFEGIPQQNPTGKGIRNLVVPHWYKNGTPLIVHLTTATARVQEEKREQALVILLNTPSDFIAQFGVSIVREMVIPKYTYPRFISLGSKAIIEADGVIVFFLYGQRFAAASETYSGESLPEFETVKDVQSRLNLTDAYLRDADPRNDEKVLPVLTEIYQGTQYSPQHRLHAGAQLFLYYLYQQKDQEAGDIAQQLSNSPLLSSPDLSKTALPAIIKEDLPLILAINRRLYR
ncbi:MAG: hypothetical protein SNJ78_05185 [Spirochaetales bacterium]